MRNITRITLALTLAGVVAHADQKRWWSHVEFLASDAMAGRNTGSPEHKRAAEYVAGQFRKAGLEPAGIGGGYIQPVKFKTRQIDEANSSLALVRGGRTEPLTLGADANFSMRIDPAASVDAPLVFAGYGLKVPERGIDEFQGLDLKGAVVVHISATPKSLPAPLQAHFGSAGERWQMYKAAGAIGTLGISNPRAMDIPWSRSTLARLQPAMSLADPTLDEAAGQQFAATMNPAHADKLFAGTGHTFAELLALVDAGKPLPHFALPARVKARVAVKRGDVESQNVAGILRGSDAGKRDEYVVVSAHLDHVGAGEAIKGDGIYNGAMDNASGIATLIETAAALAAKGGLKRSIIFAAVTAEEKGLLGSRYFANRPTVPAANIVADMNTDMFLPLFPRKYLIVQGLEESDLAEDLRKVARARAIEVLSDPEPERNAFTRSDQYSFIKTGVPSLSLKVGFTKNSPEHEIVKKWRTERYHAPSDDLAQPIDRQSAEDFGKVYVEVVTAVANRPTKPQWNGESFFKRFAR